jgi:hypothetical protein
MILKDLIRTLELAPADADIRLDNGCPPGEFMSWRGNYAELSLDPHGTEDRTVGELLAAARACIGSTFTGYKGGEYTMSEHTEVWADEYGTCPGRKPVGIRFDVDGVVLVTRVEDPYS